MQKMQKMEKKNNKNVFGPIRMKFCDFFFVFLLPSTPPGLDIPDSASSPPPCKIKEKICKKSISKPLPSSEEPEPEQQEEEEEEEQHRPSMTQKLSESKDKENKDKDEEFKPGKLERAPSLFDLRRSAAAHRRSSWFIYHRKSLGDLNWLAWVVTSLILFIVAFITVCLN